jgi:hypothetical protein
MCINHRSKNKYDEIRTLFSNTNKSLTPHNRRNNHNGVLQIVQVTLSNQFDNDQAKREFTFSKYYKTKSTINKNYTNK